MSICIDAYIYIGIYEYMDTYIHIPEYVCMRMCVCGWVCVCFHVTTDIWESIPVYSYGVATISRLLKIIGLFCKRAL